MYDFRSEPGFMEKSVLVFAHGKYCVTCVSGRQILSNVLKLYSMLPAQFKEP